MSDIYDRFSAHDVAKATAASNRIIIEFLVSVGVDRATIEKAFRAKSQELLTQQFEEGAGQLLMMMGGVVPRKTEGK